MRACAPAILQPAEPFLDLSGEDIRKRMFLTTDPQGRELCLRPDLTIPVSRDYLASPTAGKPAGLLLSRPGLPPSRRRARPNSCRPASNPSAAPTPRRPTPRCSRSGSRRPRITASPRPTIRIGDVGAVRGADRRARSGAGLEAAADQGLQPQVLARARSRPAHHQRRRMRGPNIRACWRRSPAPIRRPRTRWSPISSRSPASPRSAAARSARSPTASSNRRRSARRRALPQETRALIERFLAIAGDPDEAAAELRTFAQRRQAQARRRARPVREPHRLSRRARRRCRAHPVLDRLRPRRSTTTPASCSSCTIRQARDGRPAGRRRTL